MKNKMGFTLAEVLITLGIIGVVAAMTIPTLMKNVQDVQYKTAYKKAYSTLWQAINASNANNELTPASTTTEFQNNILTIMSKLKIIKQCTSGSDNTNCWDSTGEKYGLNYSSGRPLAAHYSFIDASGMTWTMIETMSVTVAVDTNGFNKPNQWGKDRFVIRIMDENNNTQTDINTPIKATPQSDNFTNICTSNKCGTAGDPNYNTYYGTSWLYN